MTDRSKGRGAEFSSELFLSCFRSYFGGPKSCPSCLSGTWHQSCNQSVPIGKGQSTSSIRSIQVQFYSITTRVLVNHIKVSLQSARIHWWPNCFDTFFRWIGPLNWRFEGLALNGSCQNIRYYSNFVYKS